MALQDTPIKENSKPKFEDNPINSSNFEAHSQDTQGLLSAQAAFLDSYISGKNLEESYDFYLGSTDKESDVNQLAKRKAEQDVRDIEEEFITNPNGDSSSIEEQAEAVRIARENAQERGNDPDVQFAETLSGDSLDNEKIDGVASRTKLFKMLADAEEDVGGWDVTMDILKGFVPGLSTYEGYKLTGDIVNQDEAIANSARAFRSLPTDQQEKLFPELKRELENAVGEAASVEILGNLVQPFATEDVARYGDLETALDVIDLGGISALGVQFLKGVKAGFNVPKALNTVDNADTAADVSRAALMDETLREPTGLSDVTAASNAMPFDVSIEDIGQTGGLSSKIMKDLEAFFGRADKTAENIITGNGFLKEGIISTKQRARLEADTLQLLQAEKAENIRPVSRDGNNTTFEYQIRDEDGNMSDQKFSLDLTLNVAGSWNQSQIGLIRQYIGSPTTFSKGTLQEDVATAQRVDYLSSRISRQLQELQLEALRPIGLFPTPKNKASLAKVDKALLEGDEWKNADGTRGKVFKPDELRAKFDLTEKESSAYYRLNRIYNNLWSIRNAEKRSELAALNYRNVNFTRNGEASVGKTYDNAQTANGGIRSNQIDYVYDAELDDTVSVKNNGESFLKEAYDNDKVLVRMDEGYDIGEGRGHYRFALVHKDEVTDLPHAVLQRKVGYTPRIYEDGAYFVKQFTEGVVDGNQTIKIPSTLRFFDNKKEADQYRESLIEKAKKEEGMTTKQAEDKYQVLEDREIEKLSAASGEVSHGSGGLYTGARAQDDILYGLNGEKARRVNSFEALTRNIGNISKFVSINQWRLGLEQRWINTANEIFKSKHSSRRVEHFGKLQDISENVEEVRFLNRMYEQIRDWQNFPTESEQFFQTSVKNLYNWTKENDHQRLGKILGNFRTADPIAAARATAFHSLLGWFNPSQAWVQAQGASVAISLGAGKYLTRALSNTLGLQALGEGAQSAGRYGLVSKYVRQDRSEMEAIHTLWNKTGYQDSVLQTADHAAASKGYGMTIGAIKRASDRGLTFYRTGELFNRRLSFSTALERWKEANNVKTVKGMSDDDLKSVMDDANNMMLNMTKANRANWQKGLLSLPTQFLQVTTKYVETVTGLNNNFKTADIGRILLGQTALYGTAGIPVAGLGIKMASEIFDLDQQTIEDNPGIVKTVNDGFWGAMGHWIAGVDIEMSSRGSLSRGLGDFVDNWFVRESTFTEKALGAFGASSQRWAESFSRGLRAITLGEFSDIDWNSAHELTTAPVMDTVSTWRNIEKALFMENLGELYDNSGRPLDAQDYDFMDVLMQGIGFQQTSSATLYDLKDRNEGLKSLERTISSDILKRMNSFALSHPDGNYTESEWAEYKRDLDILYGGLRDPESQRRVAERIQRTMSDQPQLAQEVNRYIDNMVNNTAEDLSSWKATTVGNGLIRLGIGNEDEE